MLSFMEKRKEKLNVLKPLLYFSLFRYPLTINELFDFSDAERVEDIRPDLDRLVAQKVIFKIDQFYLCENNPEWVERRLQGNRYAMEVRDKALSVSKFISKFPYVEGVGISGSLSKGYFDKDSDIDFFIITKHNRLWIARTLLVLYKKVFLLNSRKHFCVNYFISENALEIEEKNRFTATELATLIPMVGNGSFHDFYKTNTWVAKILPNKAVGAGIDSMLPVQKPWGSRLIERSLNWKPGAWLDAFFLRLTYRRWKVKFETMDDRHFNVAMKSNKNISKHHPLNFQHTVIQRLNNKYEEIKENHNITLPLEHV